MAYSQCSRCFKFFNLPKGWDHNDPEPMTRADTSSSSGSDSLTDESVDTASEAEGISGPSLMALMQDAFAFGKDHLRPSVWVRCSKAVLRLGKEFTLLTHLGCTCEFRYVEFVHSNAMIACVQKDKTRIHFRVLHYICYSTCKNLLLQVITY